MTDNFTPIENLLISTISKHMKDTYKGNFHSIESNTCYSLARSIDRAMLDIYQRQVKNYIVHCEAEDEFTVSVKVHYSLPDEPYKSNTFEYVISTDPLIAGRTLSQWKELARRDNCFDEMVPSDLRVILERIKGK